MSMIFKSFLLLLLVFFFSGIVAQDCRVDEEKNIFSGSVSSTEINLDVSSEFNGNLLLERTTSSLLEVIIVQTSRGEYLNTLPSRCTCLDVNYRVNILSGDVPTLQIRLATEEITDSSSRSMISFSLVFSMLGYLFFFQEMRKSFLLGLILVFALSFYSIPLVESQNSPCSVNIIVRFPDSQDIASIQFAGGSYFLGTNPWKRYSLSGNSASCSTIENALPETQHVFVHPSDLIMIGYDAEQIGLNDLTLIQWRNLGHFTLNPTFEGMEFDTEIWADLKDRILTASITIVSENITCGYIYQEEGSNSPNQVCSKYQVVSQPSEECANLSSQAFAFECLEKCDFSSSGGVTNCSPCADCEICSVLPPPTPAPTSPANLCSSYRNESDCLANSCCAYCLEGFCFEASISLCQTNSSGICISYICSPQNYDPDVCFTEIVSAGNNLAFPLWFSISVLVHLLLR